MILKPVENGGMTQKKFLFPANGFMKYPMNGRNQYESNICCEDNPAIKSIA